MPYVNLLNTKKPFRARLTYGVLYDIENEFVINSSEFIKKLVESTFNEPKSCYKILYFSYIREIEYVTFEKFLNILTLSHISLIDLIKIMSNSIKSSLISLPINGENKSDGGNKTKQEKELNSKETCIKDYAVDAILYGLSISDFYNTTPFELNIYAESYKKKMQVNRISSAVQSIFNRIAVLSKDLKPGLLSFGINDESLGEDNGDIEVMDLIQAESSGFTPMEVIKHANGNMAIIEDYYKDKEKYSFLFNKKVNGEK